MDWINPFIIFTIILAADSIAGELSGGTFKLLLIRPASLSKILLSKYISVFALSIADDCIIRSSFLDSSVLKVSVMKAHHTFMLPMMGSYMK